MLRRLATPITAPAPIIRRVRGHRRDVELVRRRQGVSHIERTNRKRGVVGRLRLFGDVEPVHHHPMIVTLHERDGRELVMVNGPDDLARDRIRGIGHAERERRGHFRRFVVFERCGQAVRRARPARGWIDRWIVVILAVQRFLLEQRCPQASKDHLRRGRAAEEEPFLLVVRNVERRGRHRLTRDRNDRCPEREAGTPDRPSP